MNLDEREHQLHIKKMELGEAAIRHAQSLTLTRLTENLPVDASADGILTIAQKFTDFIQGRRAVDIKAIAKICHEANRAWCIHNGDNSQPHWDNAPSWQTESAINGVKFHLEFPDADDAASHNNWLREKREAGWSWGPVKDPEKKTHPCMVPFQDLPAEQQFKDKLFRSLVHAAAN